MIPAERPRLLGFGGVAAIGPGGPVDVGGVKQRSVLALLMLEPGAVVPLDRLIDRVWAGEPPARAEVSVRSYISHVRALISHIGLGSESLQFRDLGYVLDVPPDTVDLHQFDTLVDQAAHEPAPVARALLTRALDMYVGPPFGALAELLDLGGVTARYDERRGVAVELLTDVRLALGEHGQLPAALASEIARQPYRERLRAQLATALYRAGRPVEALRAIDEAGRLLREDVGVEPGPELRRLEAAILAHDEGVLGWTPPAVSAPVRTPSTPAVDDEVRFGRAVAEAQAFAALDRGGVVVVSGEAGIGKSALLRGLRVEALRRGIAVGWDRCPESAAGAPYRSWGVAVSTLLPDTAIHTEPTVAGQEAASALLATQLGELARLRTLGQPALIVIDDLQWADDATLSLLGFLGPELERLHIVLAVGVRRAGFAALAPPLRDCLGELARADHPVHVTLTALTRADVSEWVAATVDRAADPALVDHLVDVTGGNPFYLRELLALLESEGRLGTAFGGTAPMIPHAVQDVVRRRMSRLPPETQALLTVAAVIGRSFDLDVLAGVLDLAVGDALDCLEPALDEGLVEVDEQTTGRFAFSHAIVSSTLTAELNAARLAAHHARITDVLESLRGADVEPWVGDLAHHASAGLLAGTAAKAFDYSGRAAASAEAAQSSTDAAVQLRRALAAAAHLPGFPAPQRAALLRRLGTALRDIGDTEGRQVLVEAARLAESHGDVHAAAEILGGLDAESLWAGYDWNLHDAGVIAAVERALAHRDLTGPDRTLLTMALAGELTYVDNARSNDLFAEARTDAAELGDPMLAARVLLRWFWSVSGASGVARRVAIGDELIALDRLGGLPARLRPLAHLARVSSALELGDAALARRCVDDARALAHPVRTPTGWAHLQFAEAGLAMLDGDLVRVRGHADALRTALWQVRRYTADSSPASILAVGAAESGDTDAALAHLAILQASPYATPIHWLESWILGEAGRIPEARTALAAFDGTLPDDWLRLPLTTAAVSAAARVGDERLLRRQLPTLEPFADRFAFVGEGGFTLGPVSLALAAGDHALGDDDAARVHAEQAVAISERMGAVLWLPRAKRLLAELS